MADSSLRELRDMVEKLPDLSQLVGDFGQNHVEYHTKDGTTLGFRLWAEGEIAVQRTFLTEGATFPKHAHDQHEYLLVYQGSIVVEGAVERTGPNEGNITMPGCMVYIPPGTSHSVKVLQNCWLIGITIPAAKGYPGVRS